jgi:hypothetical protein
VRLDKLEEAALFFAAVLVSGFLWMTGGALLVCERVWWGTAE